LGVYVFIIQSKSSVKALSAGKASPSFKISKRYDLIPATKLSSVMSITL
jgi:hypothetical protein